jgi:hypothetical protein
VLFCCTRTMGASRRPAFPAPSEFNEGSSDEKLGRSAPREYERTRSLLFEIESDSLLGPPRPAFGERSKFEQRSNFG